jgi:uncharacterized protein
MARLLADGGSDSLVVSTVILEELAEVLSRQKFSSRLTEAQRQRFVMRVHAAAQWVEPAARVHECRDPDDDMVLEAALAAMQAPSETVVIVSDDRDLLTLDPWRDIRIMKPEAAMAMIEAGQR